MIKYTLKCSQDHRFDSWFASADAFEALMVSGHLSCAVCGSTEVEKAMMAPQVRLDRKAEKADRPLSTPASEMEAKMAALREHVETNSDYVGKLFATEARAIHDGAAPERAIYGEASMPEIKGLVEDGVAVAPLPFAPQRKVN